MNFLPPPPEIHRYQYIVTVTETRCKECKGSGETNEIDDYGSRQYYRCHVCNGRRAVCTEQRGPERPYRKPPKKPEPKYKDIEFRSPEHKRSLKKTLATCGFKNLRDALKALRSGKLDGTLIETVLRQYLFLRDGPKKRS